VYASLVPTKHPPLQDYDGMADEYAAHRRPHQGVLRELVEKGRLGTSSRVLEVGCGTANYLGAVRSATGCACSGIDPSEGMLVKARARGIQASFVQAKAEALPFPDASFDLVNTVDVIHHVGDRAAYYREAHRVLSREGRVCTVTESEDMIRGRQPHAFYFPDAIEAELARYPRIDDLRRMMQGGGFDAIEESTVELTLSITDARSYRDKAYSSLHLISNDAFERGLRRLETDLAKGPIAHVWRYLLLWGNK
jgi:SAM-dependent methyltransferase